MAEGADFLTRLLQDPEVQEAGQEQDSTPTGTQEGILDALSPDLLGKLPALMGALGPMMGKGNDKDDKTALLLALKPFMSPQRCDAIDKLIMLGRVGRIMQNLH